MSANRPFAMKFITTKYLLLGLSLALHGCICPSFIGYNVKNEENECLTSYLVSKDSSVRISMQISQNHYPSKSNTIVFLMFIKNFSDEQIKLQSPLINFKSKFISVDTSWLLSRNNFVRRGDSLYCYMVFRNAAKVKYDQLLQQANQDSISFNIIGLLKKDERITFKNYSLLRRQ
jgi:hypothetical protein